MLHPMQVMDDENGEILHQQRVHDSALVKMEGRAHGMGIQHRSQPEQHRSVVPEVFAHLMDR